MSDTEAEDRTQAPSKQRRLLARQQGQVAQSKELTAALGLFGAAIVLRFCGRDLATTLLSAFREPFASTAIETANPSEVVSRLRFLALDLARPCLLVLSGYAVAAFAGHQAQVRGLWAPGLIAPDPSRLWKAGQGPGLRVNAAKGAWGLLKTALIAILAAWVVWAEWNGLLELSNLETAAIAGASGLALCRVLLVLSIALVFLGLLDYSLSHFRFEASLRMTPDQHREELRSMDGDPSVRARRRQIAKAWRLDSGEVLQGASLMITGPSGLTIVISGGPPPRKVSIATILAGTAGERLRKAAERQGFPSIDDHELARDVARRQPPTQPLSADLLVRLAAIWIEKATPSN